MKKSLLPYILEFGRGRARINAEKPINNPRVQRFPRPAKVLYGREKKSKTTTLEKYLERPLHPKTVADRNVCHRILFRLSPRKGVF